MAVKIDDDTYDIAVACLSASFISESPISLQNCYLLINCFVERQFENEKCIVVTNYWCDEETFNERYYFVDKDIPGKFAIILPK